MRYTVDLVASRDDYILPVNKQKDNDNIQANPLHLLQFSCKLLAAILHINKGLIGI